MRSSKNLVLALVFCGLTTIAVADYKAKIRTTAAGGTVESSIFIQGARQRQVLTDNPVVTLYQCDLRRVLLINPANKSYRIVPLGSGTREGSADAARPARTLRSGGAVTFTTTIMDSGLRKVIRGFTARNIKTETSTEATPGACNPARAIKMSSDGWYLELPGTDLSCTDGNSASLRLRPEDPVCTDRVHFQTKGHPPTGLPALLQTTMATSEGEVTVKQELVELQSLVLDKELFEVPAGYKRVNTQAELLAGASAPHASPQLGAGIVAPNSRPSRSTRSGEQRKALVRIGVVQFGPATTDSEARMSLRFGHHLNAYGVETVLLEATTESARGDVEAEAREKNCAYFLIAEIKESVGISAEKNAAEDSARSVSFQLYEVGSAGTPRLEGTVSPEAEEPQEAVLKRAAQQITTSVGQSLIR